MALDKRRHATWLFHRSRLTSTPFLSCLLLDCGGLRSSAEMSSPNFMVDASPQRPVYPQSAQRSPSLGGRLVLYTRTSMSLLQ